MEKVLKIALIFFYVSNGWAQSHDVSIYISDTQGKFKLKLNNKYQEFTFNSTPVIRLEDFSHASVTKSKYDLFALEVSLNSLGAEKLKKITKENMGKYLGFVYNNKLIAAPQITAELAHGIFTLMGDISESEFYSIEKLINTRDKK